MRIIPAIDIYHGKCVRLSKGNYDTQKIYSENPVDIAKSFEDNGISYLHLVDLDGAKSQKIINYKVLETIATKTNLIIDFGGGIKSIEDVKIAFDSGASKITGGTIASKKPQLFLELLNKYGSKQIILGADCNNRKIATNGWFETSSIDVVDFIQEFETKGINEVICTDISKDGMLQGPSFDLYKEILLKTKINLVASGGVSSINDLIKLKQIGCEGAIIGKAIYEGKITLKQLYNTSLN